MATRKFVLRSYEFRREREKTWRELERLVDRVEKSGIKNLSAAELTRLPALYRATLSALSVARAISLDRALLDYLEGLCSRAYFAVYGTKRHPLETIAEFFAVKFPQTFRRFRWQMAISGLVLILGGVTGFAMTAWDIDNYYAFVPDAMAQGRDPAASTEELREPLYDPGTAGDELLLFAMSLFDHNARIGIMAFCLGFAAGIPCVLLIFYNGTVLGAFAALYHDRGLSVELWAWLLPHGVTELLAVVLCGGAGLVLAESLLLPGRHTRLENLALRGREAAVIVLGAVILFFIAGLIEGIFRQVVKDLTLRYAMATATGVWWIVYFGLVGRGARAEQAVDPGDEG